MIISISGVDGSGKSTAVESLAIYFNSQGKKVVTVELGEFFLLRYPLSLVKSFLKSPPKSAEAIDLHNPFLHQQKKPFLTKLILIPIILDNWLNYLRLKTYSRLGYVVICDRYFFDRIVGLQYYGYTNELLTNIYLSLTPPPTKAFFLDQDEQLCLQREQKHKHSLEFYKELRERFHTILRGVKVEIIHVDTLSKEQVLKKIINSLPN